MYFGNFWNGDMCNVLCIGNWSCMWNIIGFVLIKG